MSTHESWRPENIVKPEPCECVCGESRCECCAREPQAPEPVITENRSEGSDWENCG